MTAVYLRIRMAVSSKARYRRKAENTVGKLRIKQLPRGHRWNELQEIRLDDRCSVFVFSVSPSGFFASHDVLDRGRAQSHRQGS